ncbi:DUF5062 family protein [Dongshaea marina]|uniref:DUF5062 family protein n=1 Tax=Dongshaea marina TaxID=2047966 RepID=UPI000D3E14B8|nr:DUF5062 family protein [Dongshaea marina]
MKKYKNEAKLLKEALKIGEMYAKSRGFTTFGVGTSDKDKVECIYRLLVQDKLLVPLAEDKENGVNMRHRLAIWIANKLPEDHPLLEE